MRGVFDGIRDQRSGGIGSDPLTKLVDVVSKGIGSTFRPGAMRREADAEAYKIRALAAAQADAKLLLTNAEDQAEVGRIATLSDGDHDLAQRARRRVLSREIEGQINIETIAENATKALPEYVSDKPLSEDWRRQFFAGAENVCDQDLQFLWGKVLAGEVATPGSYSIRTLEVLKNLSKNEAETFRKACGFAFQGGWIPDVGRDLGHSINQSFEPHGFKYPDLLSLRDAGLIHEGESLYKEVAPLPGNAPMQFYFINNGVFMHVSSSSSRVIAIPSLIFTNSGVELQSLIEVAPLQSFLVSVANMFRRGGLTVKKATAIQTPDGTEIMEFTQEF